MITIRFVLDSEAQENLLDLGLVSTEGPDGTLLVTVQLEENEEVLLESLSPAELAEFFGIDSELLIHLEVGPVATPYHAA